MTDIISLKLTYRRDVDSDTVLTGLGRPSPICRRFQRAEQNYANPANVHLLTASNTLPRTSEPSIIFRDH